MKTALRATGQLAGILLASAVIVAIFVLCLWCAILLVRSF